MIELITELFPADVMSAFVTAAIAGASVLGNAIFGGVSSHNARKAQKRQTAWQRRVNRDWYNRRYNDSMTERADMQRLLSKTNDAIAKRNRAAAGKRSVVGGTDASLASTQQANAAQMANAMSNLAAQDAARKDKIEDAYITRDMNIEQTDAAQTAAYEQQKGRNIAAAVTGALNTAAQISAANSGAKAGATARKGGGEEDAKALKPNSETDISNNYDVIDNNDENANLWA